MAWRSGVILYGNATASTGANSAGSFVTVASSYTYGLIGAAAYTAMVANGGISAATRNAIMAKSIRYFDMWGKATYTAATSDWERGPGDVGDLDVTLNSTVHCFRMTDRHIERLASDVEMVCQGSRGLAAGAFMDDYGYDRRTWTGSHTIRNQVWAPHDGRAGWHFHPNTGISAIESGWNTARVDRLSGYLAGIKDRTGAAIVMNGLTAPGSGHAKMFEGYGRWITSADLAASANSGDWLVVKGRDVAAAGGGLSWYTIQDSDSDVLYGGYSAGVSYQTIFRDARTWANSLNMVLCLGFHDGGSHASSGFNSDFALVDDVAQWSAY